MALVNLVAGTASRLALGRAAGAVVHRGCFQLDPRTNLDAIVESLGRAKVNLVVLVDGLILPVVACFAVPVILTHDSVSGIEFAVHGDVELGVCRPGTERTGGDQGRRP